MLSITGKHRCCRILNPIVVSIYQFVFHHPYMTLYNPYITSHSSCLEAKVDHQVDAQVVPLLQVPRIRIIVFGGLC